MSLSKNKISVHTAAYDGYDLSVILPSIAALGVQDVELGFVMGYSSAFDEELLDPSNARRIARRMSEAGLKASAVSAHMDLTLDDAVPMLKRRLEFARDIGAGIVVTNSGTPARRRQFDRNIAELSEFAAALGLVIALENPGDGQEDIVNDGRTGAEFVESLHSDAVRLCYDFGNVIPHFKGQVRPEEDFRIALPYCANLHVKDVHADERGWTFPALGQGLVDFGRIFDYMARQPAAPVLCIEIPTRVSRARDASPRIAADLLSLTEIGTILSSSLAYIHAQARDQ
jgi:sugar phosphate isomerase/epimerase